MTRAKRIYILIIKVNKLFSFFSSRCFLTEIENMYSVFLSSYRNTRESLGQLEKAVETLACGSCSNSISLLPNFLSCFYLTNRFHVAVCLFSNRSRMTSNCGKNENVAREAYPGVSLMFLPHFDVFCDLLLNQTNGNMESIFYIITKSLFFNFKIFQHNAKAGFLSRLCMKKSHLTWSMIYTKLNNFIGCYA